MSSALPGRRFRAFAGWSMDLKLGGRMLVKYPGLTLVGGLAMAFAICVGAVIFQVMSILVAPSLPLPEGDRLVRIRSWDVAANRPEPRTLYDFTVWRSTLHAVTELGAWRDVTRNLLVTDGDARPVQVAEITPSAFRVADGIPLMGRVLTDADGRPDAPAVAVIGHDIWRTRFGSDPAVLGRRVQLGTEHVTIVGVMREGFAFPVAHDVWTPLRVVNDAHAPRSGPEISVFGLLAPGATLETAQAELTTVGRRLAGDEPATHAQLQPHVAPYAKLDAGPSLDNDEIGIFASIYAFAVILLVLICSNVALLLFARAATRESELAVRTALGASRSRIVAQMFAEALVLGGAAGLAGLAAAHVALSNWGLPFLEANLGRLPFWYDVSLSPATVLFALGLTVLGSAIAGVVPALKVTRRVGSRLKQATAGAGGLQFGGIWTVVIVVQVAVTVAFPAVVYQEQWQLRHIETFEAGFPVEEYLAARIQMDAPASAAENTETVREAQRVAFAARLEELRRRVAAAPGVAGVTFANRLPRDSRPQSRIELPEDANREQLTGGPDAPLRVATVARVDPSYFETLGTGVLAGRAFTAADLAPGTQVAIVDQGFVDQVLQGRNAIGQQVRFRSRGGDPGRAPNPWMEIVGVVKDLGMGTPTRPGRAAGLYLPSSPDGLDEVQMMVHVPGDPLAFAPQLREIATAVDPALRLTDVQRVDQVTDVLLWIVRLWLRVTLVMTAVALVLSLSGIYAVLSFVVARRTREIGVRVALGADRRRVVTAIFKRPLTHVAVGVFAGNALLALLGSVETEMPGLTGDLSVGQLAILAAYGVVMLGVCLLACIVPTRRALSVEPTIALRVE
ncbi:MAG TPA: ABC transporter permease [Vicinamibacterales bacterium]|nr:ABC transporter permease [Vicinamibacterales bacterium]